MRMLLVVIPLVLAVFAAVDCLRTDQEQCRGIPRPLWLLLIVLAPIAGALAWLIAGKDRPNRPERGAGSSGTGAPDDDPDFLRRLDEENFRRRQREARGEKDPDSNRDDS